MVVVTSRRQWGAMVVVCFFCGRRHRSCGGWTSHAGGWKVEDGMVEVTKKEKYGRINKVT
jgi:hypothetical protein